MNKTAKPLRVLCLSLWSPPKVRPQAILLQKMLPEWIRQGVEPVLVTYEDCRGWEMDIPIEYLPQFRLHPLLGRLPFIGRALERRYTRAMAERIAPLLEKYQCDLLYSFAKPHISNVIGALVKKQTGIPFVAHMSDPWYENWFGSRFFSNKKYILKLETLVMQTADQIHMIAEEMKELVMCKYPDNVKQKARVAHHCFDPALYPTKIKKRTVHTFAHLGILRSERNPSVLFAAARLLLQKHPDRRGQFAIELVGSINDYTAYTGPQLRNLIAAYTLEEVVRIVPTVAFQESLRHMKEVHDLVVIDVDRPKCSYILSKAIDYLGSGTPIIGIMPPDNPTAKLITQAGYVSFAYSEAEQLANYMYQRITGRITHRPNRELIDSFSVQQTTARLLRDFRDTCR